MSTEVDTIEKVKIKVPSLYKVVFINDDFTPMEFVIDILRSIFDKSLQEATAVTMEVHERGRGVAGIYTLEIAQQKVEETTTIAIKYGHPLKSTCEEA